MALQSCSNILFTWYSSPLFNLWNDSYW